MRFSDLISEHSSQTRTLAYFWCWVQALLGVCFVTFSIWAFSWSLQASAGLVQSLCAHLFINSNVITVTVEGGNHALLKLHYPPSVSGGTVTYPGTLLSPIYILVKSWINSLTYRHTFTLAVLYHSRATNLFSHRKWIGGQSLAFFSISGHI